MLCSPHFPQLRCDSQSTPFPLRAPPSFQLLRPKPWVSSWPLSVFIQSTSAPCQLCLPLSQPGQTAPVHLPHHLAPELLQQPLNDFLAATFAPQQSICNTAAKLSRLFKNASLIMSSLCLKLSNGSHLTQRAGQVFTEPYKGFMTHMGFFSPGISCHSLP